MALGSILCADLPDTDDVHTNEPSELMDATTLGPRNIPQYSALTFCHEYPTCSLRMLMLVVIWGQWREQKLIQAQTMNPYRTPTEYKGLPERPRFHVLQ